MVRGPEHGLIAFPSTVEPVSGILLATEALGAPEFAVKNVRIAKSVATATTSAISRLVIVSHASDALNLLKLTVTDPSREELLGKDRRASSHRLYVRRTDRRRFRTGNLPVKVRREV